MPKLSYEYVYFAGGPHSRQPRAAGGPGGFTLIQTLSGGTLSAGDEFIASPQPPSQMVEGNTYPFAFMNVSGGKNGGVTSFHANAPPPAVKVASANIAVLVVYAPTGNGNGNSGATIDSFDDTTGSLFNDTFVTVAPDPGGLLAKSGNVEGFVVTTNAETITALSPTAPTKVVFEHWLTLPSTVSKPANLAVAQGSSPLALAFYKAPPKKAPPPLDACHEALNSLTALSQHGDRPKLTVKEFNAIKAQLEACVKAKKLTQQQVTEAINAYLVDLNPPQTPGQPPR